MRIFFTVIFLIIISTVYALNPIVAFKISSYYDTNIIKLSEEGKDDFLNNYNSDKYNISTLDDWVTKFNVDLGVKNKFPKKHTQIIKLSLYSSNYYKNSVKSNVNLAIKFKQYISKKINFSLYYKYFPKIYLRKYISEFDETKKYHDFSYAKNQFSAYFNFLPVKFLSITTGLNYEQLYFNEYFTEYDTNNTEKYLKLTFNSGNIINFFTGYSYKESEQINKNQGIKNPSYKGNKFSFGFKLLISKIEYISNLKYEEVFFSSENPADTYHFERNDFKTNLTERLAYKINKKYKIGILGEFAKRLTNSPNQNVKSDKTYKVYRIGVNLIIILF